MHGAYPILDCEAAKAFEAEHFAGDEAREWAAMSAAGAAAARGILADHEEIGAWPKRPRVLVLAGKGHNAGDALIAAAELRSLLADTDGAPSPGPRNARAVLDIDVVFVFGERAPRPLAMRAWRALVSDDNVAGTTRVLPAGADWAADYEVVIDGVFGFQFRPPMAADVAAILTKANAIPARLRAAVDLPSGLDAPDAFQADFTYATGIVKTPLLHLANAGRVRFLDLGFPLSQATADACFGLGASVLDPLRDLRPARSDKRTFGHVLVVAGSRRYPGAALMATLAALRGGAGLVTAAVPESLVPTFAAQVPEAMWLGLPETPDGGLALEGLGMVREAFARASALVLGPGLGRERETLALAAEIAKASPHPLVIDADALQPEIVSAGKAPRVLTPHAGEWERIAAAINVDPTAGRVLRHDRTDLSPTSGRAYIETIVVRKGPVTRIEVANAADTADRAKTESVYHNFFGGPVLARGGSGDLLAGLTGAVLARTPKDPLGSAVQAVVWHGLAADLLARARGATAVRTTELLDFLATALRDSR